MKITDCPVCGAERRAAFRATLLGKHEVNYHHCEGCGLLQTEEPYWLDEAYQDAINVTDTGLVARNIDLASKLAVMLFFCFDRRASYVDVAGGYGMLTRLMRDHGFDYYWSDKYCANLLARGFEIDKKERPVAAMTAFEVLEHVYDPLAFVQSKMKEHGCRTLIFTTELYSGDAPPKTDWWYYAFHSGQHISFYQQRTLKKVANVLGLNFYSLQGIHILSDRQLHINWMLRMAMGRPASILVRLIRRVQGTYTESDHKMLSKPPHLK